MQRRTSDKERNLVIEKNEGRGEGRKDDLSVEGPFGWRVRANGKELSLFIIIALGVGSALWALRDHDLRSTETLNQAVAERTKQIERVALAQTDLQDSMNAMIYVLSLTPEDRSKLKLEMPQSLRAKMLKRWMFRSGFRW